jgi:hypothetical protein
MPTPVDELAAALPHSARPSIPGYTLDAELGRGGMGVVYKARHAETGTVCALKVLHGPVDADARQRFRAEAAAARRLDHPHIVRVFAAGEAGRVPYLVMEYAAGGSLDRRRPEWPMPAREAASLVAALAEGLAHAHARGIVHRDLKPANVLLTADGSPKVADFGLARRLDAHGPRLTAAHAVLGTPVYMPPEQAAGQARHAGPAADVWALGVILSELLAGQPPFAGQSADEIRRRVRHEPPSPLPRSIPPTLAAVVARCLRKDPADRYATAAALANDLRSFLTGAAVGLGGGSPDQPSLRQNALVELPTAGTWEAHAGPAWAAAFAPYGGDLLSAGEDGTLRLWRAESGAVRRLFAGHDGAVTAAAFWPDDEHILSAGADGSARLWRLPDGELVWRADLGQPLRAAAPAFDGTAALVAVGHELVVCDPATGREVRRLGGGKAPLAAVAALPDGMVVAASAQGTVRTWSYGADGAALDGFDARSGRTKSAVALAVSADGRLGAAAAGPVVRLWAPETGKDVRALEGHGSPVTALAFTPDGQWLASGSESGSMRLWDAWTGRVLATTKLPKGLPVRALTVAPDGGHLAAAAGDGRLRLWRLPPPARPLPPA